MVKSTGDAGSAGTPPDPEDVTVDARGLRCPLPVIRLAAAAKSAPAGTTVFVLATDPAAAPDIAAWCRMRGHQLVAQYPVDKHAFDGRPVAEHAADPDLADPDLADPNRPDPDLADPTRPDPDLADLADPLPATAYRVLVAHSGGSGADRAASSRTQ